MLRRTFLALLASLPFASLAKAAQDDFQLSLAPNVHIGSKTFEAYGTLDVTAPKITKQGILTEQRKVIRFNAQAIVKYTIIL